MAIYLFSGVPGSFKSVHATEEAIFQLKRGLNVICNYPINCEKAAIKIKGKFEYWYNTDITVKNLLKFAEDNHVSNFDCQTYLIIDEASAMFNSRLYNNKDRLNWIYFFANHRHFNYNIILITQSDIMLDKQIRALIEYQVKHRSISHYKLIFRFISKIFGGVYLTTVSWYQEKLRISSSLHRLRKKYANCFDTMALFIDKPKLSDSKSKSSKVVIIDEQTTSNDTQRTENEATTLLCNNVSVDNDTGVAVFDNVSNSDKS